LLLADQLMEGRPYVVPPPAPESSGPDPALVQRAEALAGRLESLAQQLENDAAVS